MIATTSMSTAAMCVIWFHKKLRQVGEGAFGRRGRYLPTVANLDAELEEFAVDARCAPERVVEAHPTDQVTDILRSSWAVRDSVPVIASKFESLCDAI